MASQRDRAALELLTTRYPIQVTTDNCLLAQQVDILILAVKPQHIPDVLQEIAPVVQGKKF